jgi:hypothetical protein
LWLSSFQVVEQLITEQVVGMVVVCGFPKNLKGIEVIKEE